MERRKIRDKAGGDRNSNCWCIAVLLITWGGGSGGGGGGVGVSTTATLVLCSHLAGVGEFSRHWLSPLCRLDNKSRNEWRALRTLSGHLFDKASQLLIRFLSRRCIAWQCWTH